MVIEYEVLKPFGILKKGDCLTLDDNVFKFENELSSKNNDFYSYARVAFTPEVAEQYAKSGLLNAIAAKDDDAKDSTKEAEDINLNKIKELSKLIAQLKNTYNQRKTNVEKKYNDGKIQTCVKVEHDTVYFNMMKLLNKFEAIINE